MSNNRTCSTPNCLRISQSGSSKCRRCNAKPDVEAEALQRIMPRLAHPVKIH